MHIDKAPVLEEGMDGVGGHGAHPEGGGKEVGPGPKMLYGPQIPTLCRFFWRG